MMNHGQIMKQPQFLSNPMYFNWVLWFLVNDWDYRYGDGYVDVENPNMCLKFYQVNKILLPNVWQSKPMCVKGQDPNPLLIEQSIMDYGQMLFNIHFEFFWRITSLLLQSFILLEIRMFSITIDCMGFWSIFKIIYSTRHTMKFWVAIICRLFKGCSSLMLIPPPINTNCWKHLPRS